MSSSLMRSGITQPDELEQDERADAQKMMTQRPAQELPLEQVRAARRRRRRGVPLMPRYRSCARSARSPTSRPPIRPAKPCVYIDAERVVDVAERAEHGEIVVARGRRPTRRSTPIAIAPQPFTKPAAGVIATRPTIMPLTLPISDGLRLGHVVPRDPYEKRHRGRRCSCSARRPRSRRRRCTGRRR